MEALDLFAGAGGASLALASVGLHPIGFERDDDACATHTAAGHATVQADLSSHGWHRWLGWNRGRYPVLHASPPCQPFSAAGKGAGRDDARDGMPWTLRAVEVVRPALVTVENVRGLTYKRHAAYLAWFLGELRALGYTVDHRVLNAADYGVPQTRQRLIVIGHRDGVIPKWPDPTHSRDGTDGRLPWVSMAEALGWDGGLVGFPRRSDTSSNKSTEEITLDGTDYRARDLFPTDGPSQAITEKGRSWSRWVLRPGGGQYQSGEARASRPAGGANRRLHPIDEPAPSISFGHDVSSWAWERPATTVNGDPRISRPGHHAEDESGSQQRDAVRVELHELAALQGFPPDYPFCGTRTSVARQIGNAVPWQLLAAVLDANRDGWER